MNNHAYASHVFCSEGSTSYSADSCYFKKDEVDELVEKYRPVFEQYPDICSINLEAAPYFDLCKGYREDDEDDHYSFDWAGPDGGWRFRETLIFRDGSVWLRFNQKHAHDIIMEVELV